MGGEFTLQPEFQAIPPWPDFSGVPTHFVHSETKGGLEGNPALQRTGPEVYRQSFSGVDFQITAVLPYEFDVSQQQDPQIDKLRAVLSKLQAQLNTLAIGALEAVEEQRQLRQDINNIKNQIRDLENNPQPDNTTFIKTFAEIQTLSVTTRRTVGPVRRMGESFPAYYVRGPRTVAGSMIFILLDEDILLDFHRRTAADSKDGEAHFVSDRLPPFNILITGINEYGHIVQGALLGVTLLASGMTLSVEDLYTEVQYTYVARSMIPMARRDRHNQIVQRVGRGLPQHGLGAASELQSDPIDILGPLGKSIPQAREAVKLAQFRNLADNLRKKRRDRYEKILADGGYERKRRPRLTPRKPKIIKVSPIEVDPL